MKTTCEHCKLWQGSESSSRADCLHPNVLGTTSFDDTCVHHNPKVQRDHAPMEDSGRISGWRLTSGAVMYGTTGLPMHSSDNNQIIPGDKVFYQSTDGTVKPYTRERIIFDCANGPFTYNDNGSTADVVYTHPMPQWNSPPITRLISIDINGNRVDTPVRVDSDGVYHRTGDDRVFYRSTESEKLRQRMLDIAEGWMK